MPKAPDPPRIAEAYRYTNGNVLCVDDDGAPIPECQGKYAADLCEKVKKYADGQTRFYWAKWGGVQIPVSKENW